MSLPEIRLTDPRALRGYAHPLRMALVGLLRREGPLTATGAAEHLGESVPNCSFHLRQLAKYGLAERVPGADARERPWRATAMVTSWEHDSDDPGGRAAARQLSATMLDHYARRGREYLDRLDGEPAAWRAVTGFGDTIVYATPDELAELNRRIDALLAGFDERQTDRSTRPADARPIAMIQLIVPLGPASADPADGADGGAP